MTNLITAISSIQKKKKEKKNQSNNISVASTKVRDARFKSILWWALQNFSNYEITNMTERWRQQIFAMNKWMNCFFKKCVCFLLNFLVVKTLGVFLCVSCVVLIFECIYCGTKFAKDIMSLDFNLFGSSWLFLHFIKICPQAGNKCDLILIF